MTVDVEDRRIPDPETQPWLEAPDAGRRAYGLGRSASYEAVKRGDLPVLRCGRKLVVPTAALRRLLQLDG